MAVQLSEAQLAEVKKYLDTIPEEEREEKLDEIVQDLTENNAPQCPFCLMSEGKIKTTSVFNDDLFLVVLEINPANPGHLLIVPKRHVATVADLTQKEDEELILLIKNLTKSIHQVAEGVNVLLAEGKSAGQKTDHLVLQVIPRKQGDAVTFAWQPKASDEKQLTEWKEKILKHITPPKPKEVLPPPKPENPEDDARTLQRQRKRRV